MDRILLAIAVLVAAGSWGWFGGLGRVHGRTPRGFNPRAKFAAAYVSTGVEVPKVAPGKWLAPAAQPRGPEWVYEVFTPPEINYETGAQKFTVRPPRNHPGPKAPGSASELELVAVQREPYRLQLLGFVGDEGRYLGTFEDLQTTEVFLAGPGRTVPGLGLVITDFTVDRRPVTMPDGMISNQRVAHAVVRDERTASQTTLWAGERSYTGELRAVLMEAESEGETLGALRAGEEFRSTEHRYIVERLQLEPPVAELTQLNPSSLQPIRLSLTPKTQSLPSPLEPAN